MNGPGLCISAMSKPRGVLLSGSSVFRVGARPKLQKHVTDVTATRSLKNCTCSKRRLYGARYRRAIRIGGLERAKSVNGTRLNAEFASLVSRAPPLVSRKTHREERNETNEKQKRKHVEHVKPLPRGKETANFPDTCTVLPAISFRDKLRTSRRAFWRNANSQWSRESCAALHPRVS